MSKLEYVTDFNTAGVATNIAQFNFKNGNGDTSPFDYLADADAGSGCGAINKGGKIIIETGACALKNFYAFVTGFSNTVVTPNTQTIDAKALIVSDSTVTPDLNTQQVAQTVDTSEAGYIFKKDAEDTSIGLWISYSSDVDAVRMEAIQVSFVFVGLRDYTPIALMTPGTYPTQSILKRDDFEFVSFNSISDSYLNMDSNVGVLLTSYLGETGPFSTFFCGFVQASPQSSTTLKASDLTGSLLQCLYFRRRDDCTISFISPAAWLSVPDFANGVTATGDIAKLAITDSLFSSSIDISGATTYKFKMDWTAVTDAKSGTMTINYGIQPVGAYIIQFKMGYGETDNSLSNI